MKPSWRSWANRVLLEPCWANLPKWSHTPPRHRLGAIGPARCHRAILGPLGHILGVGPQSHLGANWANILVGPQSHLGAAGPTSLSWATEPSWVRWANILGGPQSHLGTARPPLFLAPVASRSNTMPRCWWQSRPAQWAERRHTQRRIQIHNRKQTEIRQK